MKRVIKDIVNIVRNAPNTAAAERAIHKYKRESLYLIESDSREKQPFVWYPSGHDNANVLSLTGEGEEVFTEFFGDVMGEDESRVSEQHMLRLDFGQRLLWDAERLCQVPVNEAEAVAFHRAATALAAVAAEAAAMVARYIEKSH